MSTSTQLEQSNDFILQRANPLLYSLITSDQQYFSPSSKLLQGVTTEELEILRNNLTELSLCIRTAIYNRSRKPHLTQPTSEA